MSAEISNYDPWPALSAEEFKPSSRLLYMCTQMLGKLMLTQPFTPHWANLAMPITSRGFTTGPIPYQRGTFSVDIDCIDHVVYFTASWGKTDTLKLTSMSVADLTEAIFKKLAALGVTLRINQIPQETSDTTPFDQDNEPRVYDGKVVNAWWRILVSTTCVLQEFHSRFYGITPQVGLCWGTLDLRDARYKGVFLPTPKEFNFITRNAMDDEQFEVGFSASNEKYPIPSFFAFAYPTPDGFENAKMQGSGVKWVPAINEFILDYEDLRKSKNPEQDLLNFFESTYQAFATLAKWDPKLVVSGKPV
ncbi:MAG: DUF5996 family protein [Pseudomonadota bacterium]